MTSESSSLSDEEEELNLREEDIAYVADDREDDTPPPDYEDPLENSQDLQNDDDESNDQQMEDEIPDNSVYTFKNHQDSVYSVRFHPSNSRVILSGGGDDRGFLWKQETAPQPSFFELSGHTDTVTAVEFNYDGKLAATGSLDGTVKVWEVETGKLVSTLEGPAGPEFGFNWLKWHSKGNVILAGNMDGSSWMWLSSGQLMKTFYGHSASVTCGEFSLNGKLVLTGSEDGTLRVWDPKSGNTLFHFSGYNYHQSNLTCIATCASNLSLVASGSTDSTTRLLNIDTGKVLSTLSGHAESVESCDFSKIQGFLATGSLDKKIFIWDLNSLQKRQTFEHQDGVIKVEWLPDSPLLLSASIDQTLCLWDGRSSNLVPSMKFEGHSELILDFDISRDGQRLVSGSDDHTAKIFNLASS